MKKTVATSAKEIDSFIVVVPAAGVGKRMQASCPKQYLMIEDHTILEHTVNRLLSHPKINHVILPLSAEDAYFNDTCLANNPKVLRVKGGKERVDSVLAGLSAIDSEQYPWVLVHDAARPCVSHHDIDQLIAQCQESEHGGLLAMPVRDTMKSSQESKKVNTTVDRSNLWHALTPQLFKTNELITSINLSLKDNATVTDESSAIEYAQLPSLLVEGSGENIKITRPDDLALATFILAQQRAKTQGLLCE